MKLTLIAACVGFVAAQTFQGLPSCATSCLTAFEAGSTIAGCNSIDITCICSNKDFLSSIACCLAAQCSPEDQTAAVTYALNLCKANAVTNLPTAVSCTSTSSTLSSGTSATPATTSPTSITSGGASSTSSGTAAAAQTSNAAPQKKPGGGAGLFGGLAAVAIFL